MNQDQAFRDLSLLILCGSTQPNSQSLKVAKCLHGYLSDIRVESYLLDLHRLNLPAVGVGSDDDWQPRFREAQSLCSKVAGVVLVSPEYNGGPSPAILNFMLYINSELRHKPVFLVGVSAGRGGTYPIAALKQIGSKDTGYVVIPETTIVSQVNDLLNDGTLEIVADTTTADKEVRQALQDNLKWLIKYAQALRGLRTD